MLFMKFGFVCFFTHLATNARYATAQVPLPPASASFKSGYCPTVPVESFNTIECIDDTGCPGIAKCCPTLKGNNCLVPTAQPPKGTSQPCGGLNEQWDSCTTPCPPSCEYSNSYDVYRSSNPFYSRSLLTGCTGCIAGCTCVSGHLRERLQGSGVCVPAGSATCVAYNNGAYNNGQSVYGQQNPYDIYARYAYPNGLRYPLLYWNALWNRNAGTSLVPSAQVPFGPLSIPPVGPPQIAPRYPYYYPENVWAQQQPLNGPLPGPDPFFPYSSDKRSKDDNKKDIKEEKQVIKEKKEEKS